MEKTCDRNQNVCDNNISNINSNSEKTLCDEKQEDPSILVQKFSAILPSNFLNLSPRLVLSKRVRLTDRRWFACCQMAGLVHARTVRAAPHDLFLPPRQPRTSRTLRSHLDCSGKEFSFLFFSIFFTFSFQFSSYYEVMRLGYQVTGVGNLTGWTWLLFLLGKNDQ